MQAMTWITYWGVTSLAAACLAGVISPWKNRDHSYWIAWCFLLPPLVVLLLIMPKRPGPKPRQPTLDEIDRRTGS